MILLCKVHQLKCILAALFVPPPFNSEALRTLLAFQLDNPDLPLIVVDDLNCYMDPVLDKHPPPVTGRKIAQTTLWKFTEEVGWIDPWRGRNPQQKQFFCFSKTHLSLSRIDLCLYTPQMSRLLCNIKYLVRGISDHSPLLVWMLNLTRPCRGPLGNSMPFG